jgi:hypothetical protein
MAENLKSLGATLTATEQTLYTTPGGSRTVLAVVQVTGATGTVKIVKVDGSELFIIENEQTKVSEKFFMEADDQLVAVGDGAKLAISFLEMNDAGISVSDAFVYAQNAQASATAAAGSATDAAASAQSAADSLAAMGTGATDAANSAQAAADSALEASGYASAANLAKTGAESARDAAVTARNAAQSAETNAAGSASDALTHKNAAETAVTNAESARDAAITARDVTLGYRDQAQTAATNADNSATAASGSASDANTAKLAAQTAESNAATSATAAQQWAEQPEDIVVMNDGSDHFSALHHANKAGASATNALSSEQTAASARDAAISARDEAITARNDAQTAAGNASASAGNAQAAATNASTSASNAAGSATDAADAALLAERWSSAPVNEDVDGAGTRSAYHWAQQAIATASGQLTWRGLFDASGGSYPPSPTTGDYYRISVAGTLPDFDVNVGDALIYGGTDGWQKLDNTEQVTSVSGRTGDVTINQILTDLKGVDGANSGLDADLLDGQQASDFAPATHVGSGGAAHADVVAGGASGFMTGADKTKLDGIEAGATGDMTPEEILTAVKTVDGSTSGLDADLLDGQHASDFAPSAHVGAAGTGAHPLATASGSAGFLSGADKAKLDGIEAGATGDMTPTEILTAIKSVDGPSSGLDADTLDGQQASAFAPATHVGSGASAHAAVVANGDAGFMTGADKAKLDGIEAGATADMTASEILTAVKTVDGAGSGLDADTLDGQQASAFAAASHGHGASEVSYDNASSGLAATTAQAAIDELGTTKLGTGTTTDAIAEGSANLYYTAARAKADVTKADVGLGNVPNVDATVFANWQQNGAPLLGVPIWNGSQWLTAGAGSLVWVGNLSANNSGALSMTGATNYYEFVWVIHNLVPTTDGDHLFVQFSTDNGTTYLSGAADYQSTALSYTSAGAGSIAANAAINAMRMTVQGLGGAAGETGYCGILHIVRNNTAKKNQVYWNGGYMNSDGNQSLSIGSAHCVTQSPVNAVRLIMGSGTIASGNVAIYGLRI